MTIETFTWRTQIQAGMEGSFSLKTQPLETAMSRSPGKALILKSSLGL